MNIWRAAALCGLLLVAPATAVAQPGGDGGQDGGRSGGQSGGKGGGQPGGKGGGQGDGQRRCETRTVDNYPACAPSNRARVRICTTPDGQTIKFLHCLN